MINFVTGEEQGRNAYTYEHLFGTVEREAGHRCDEFEQSVDCETDDGRCEQGPSVEVARKERPDEWQVERYARESRDADDHVDDAAHRRNRQRDADGGQTESDGRPSGDLHQLSFRGGGNEPLENVVGKDARRDVERGVERTGRGEDHAAEHQTQQAGGHRLPTHQQIGVFTLQSFEAGVADAVDHRRQHPENGTHEVKEAEQPACFAGVAGRTDAGVTLDVGPVAAQEEEIVAQERNDEYPSIFARNGPEERIGHFCEKSFDAARLEQRKRNDDEHGGRENQELQYVGYDDGPQSADSDVEDAECPQQQDARIERDVGRNLDDFGDRIEERTGREERDEEEQIGVHLLRRRAETSGDVFGGRETARAVPARGDEESDGESGDGHRELDGDRYASVRVGDRPPDNERAGRKEAHEERKSAYPPRDVAASGEETFHILAGR